MKVWDLWKKFTGRRAKTDDAKLVEVPKSIPFTSRGNPGSKMNQAPGNARQRRRMRRLQECASLFRRSFPRVPRHMRSLK